MASKETRVTRQVAIAAVRRLGGPEARNDQDLVAVESPLTLTLAHPAHRGVRTLGVLMRTPGHDEDLAIGLLHAEGIVRTMADVVAVEPKIAADGSEAGDVIHVSLAATVPDDLVPGQRPLLTTSACGLCGRLAVQALDRKGGETTAGSTLFSVATLAALPAQLRTGQAAFAETGGLHAAAVFAESGERLALAEDVGRHNAVDKVVGALLRSGQLPATGAVLVVSGRVAFEIVQKAAMAGVAAVVAVGAPSSLAVEAARSAGLTLAGFVRDGQFNVYAGIERVK